jgi:glycosyltransferase involved in cell wall biosynthesis
MATAAKVDPGRRVREGDKVTWSPGHPVTLSGRLVRVCFLIDELAAAGTETQLVALIRRLDRRRVQPYLVLLRGASPVSRALEPEGCPVLRLDVGSLHSPRTIGKAISFVRFLRRERIDVLQAYFPDSSYFGVPLAALAGVPHRLRTRNNVGHWLTPLHRFLGRALNLLTTGSIANCAAARESLLRDERPRPGSVVVLENGVDLERFVQLPAVRPRRANDPACVGAVANLRPVKGLDVLLRAAALLAGEHPGLSCRIAGEGEQRAALERRAAAAGLSERFALSGAVSDVPGFLAGLDVAVLPSRAEGMSNAVLEYMAAGRPIVASAVGATPELLGDGRYGLLVPPGDAQALAAAIGKLLRQPDLARRLGAAARRRACERYSREAMVRRFEEFYTRLKV